MVFLLQKTYVCFFFFFTFLPTFLAEQMSGKNVFLKMSRNPGQEKSWARSSCKPLQKTDTQFITTTRAPPTPDPKMRRRLRRRPIFGVVVMNFESVFWKGLQKLPAQLFLGMDFLLTFSFDFLFLPFFSSNKLSKPIQQNYQTRQKIIKNCMAFHTVRRSIMVAPPKKSTRKSAKMLGICTKSH